MQELEQVFLGLGSNLGSREGNLYKAVKACCAIMDEVDVADIFESMPMYNTTQPHFLNTVLAGTTDLNPHQLLEEIGKIEARLGRDRTHSSNKGPRCIDIDILLFGERRIVTKDLIIPHPLMTEREFVLKPLLQLAGDLKDPCSGKEFAVLYSKIPSQGVYFHSTWEYIATSFGGEVKKK